VVPLLVTRPLATPLGMRPRGILRQLEDVLALLTGVGFTGVDAVHVYRALFGFLYDQVLTELQEIVERPEETDHVLRLGLHRLSIGEFPHLRELAPTWASYDGLAELDRGLDILLSGLAAQFGFPVELPRECTHPGRRKQTTKNGSDTDVALLESPQHVRRPASRPAGHLA
jgi:Tetracyclin repressor-like, C-terminal domain